MLSVLFMYIYITDENKQVHTHKLLKQHFIEHDMIFIIFVYKKFLRTAT